MRSLINPPRHARRLLGICVLLLGIARPTSRAYNATEYQWPAGTIPLILALGPAGRTLSDGNTSWDDVAKRAVDEWNANLGIIKFTPQVADGTTPGAGDGKNTVAFSETIYGDDFGDETIAVTLLNYKRAPIIGEADVLVNTHDTFDSYDGPLRDPGTSKNIDLHRVLLHEFGHVLGLDHPDKIGQTVTAIMNSVVSDTDQLTADDIGGTTLIYGDPGLLSVPIPSVSNFVVDDGHGKIFAVAKDASGKAKLQVIDPYTLSVVATVRTGTNPSALALSGGDEFLYVGVDGRGAVEQFDPGTLARTLKFTLGSQPGVTAADLAVLPGQPDSMLVSQVGNTLASQAYNGSPVNGDFAVYDHGVKRPVEEFTPFVDAGSPVLLDETGQTFYAFFGVRGTGAFVSKFALGAQGVSLAEEYAFKNTDSLDDGFAYARGLLFIADGSVDDLVSDTPSTGFAGIGMYGNYGVTVDGNLGQAYFAVPNSNIDALAQQPDANLAVLSEQGTVLIQDIATRSLLGTIALPRVAGVTKMRCWGANGLAMSISDTRLLYSELLLVIRSNLIAPGPVTGVPPTVFLGTPKFSSLDENAGVKDKLAVTRTDDDLSAPLAVTYTATGTAQDGVDYRPLSGVLTIPAGQATAKIKIVPLGSQFSDGPRTLQIRLAPNLGYRWGTVSTETILLTSGG